MSRTYKISRLDKRFGRLVVKEFIPSEHKPTLWRCLCDCGEFVIVDGRSLKAGSTKSCGCLLAEVLVACNVIRSIHADEIGRFDRKLHQVHTDMLRRCQDTTATGYKYYGGRGISVCKEWTGVHGYEAFVEYIGQRPATKHSIDRINNDGNYEPGNVRWVTRKEQNRKTRRTHYVTIYGRTQALSAWIEEIGIVNGSTVKSRIARGIDPETALTKPVNT